MICGKEIYRSREEARLVISAVNKRGCNDRLNRVYFCPDCEGYHVSSRQKKKLKRKKLIQQGSKNGLPNKSKFSEKNSILKIRKH